MAARKKKTIVQEYDISELMNGNDVLLALPDDYEDNTVLTVDAIDCQGNTFKRNKKIDLFDFSNDIRKYKVCDLFNNSENAKKFSTLMVIRLLSQKIHRITHKGNWNKITNKYEPVYSKKLDCMDIFHCNQVNMLWSVMEPEDVYWYLLHTIDQDDNFYPITNNFSKKQKEETTLRVARMFECSNKQAAEYIDICDETFIADVDRRFGDATLLE